MELNQLTKKFEELNIDEIAFNSTCIENDNLIRKMERRRKRKSMREITNKILPPDFFQNIVELENIILKDPTKKNIFDLIDLYKVNISNY